MESLQFNTPVSWLLIDLGVGFIFLVVYPRIPLPYRQFLLNLRWVLFPYIGLLAGGVSPRLMGLTGINWLTSFGMGLGLIVTILGLLLFVRSTTDFVPPLASLSLPATAVDSPQFSPTRVGVTSLLHAGAEEFHWAFLRGTLWEIAQTTSLFGHVADYWIIWLAAIIALPNILRTQTTLLATLFKVVLLLLTTILFLYTQNFWLCWLLHGLVLLLLIP